MVLTKCHPAIRLLKLLESQKRIKTGPRDLVKIIKIAKTATGKGQSNEPEKRKQKGQHEKKKKNRKINLIGALSLC